MHDRSKLPQREPRSLCRIAVALAVGTALAWPCRALAQAPAVAADHAAQMARGREIFTRQVRPLLLEHCVKCHGGEKTRGDLDLTTREGLLRDVGEGAVVVPGQAKSSRLYKLITHQQEPHMPSKAPRLGDQQIAHVAAWIDAGAPYDRPLLEKSARTARKPMTVTDADRGFWSFQPLHRPTLPNVRKSAWCRTPIDRFILAKVEEKGLTPNPAAERRTLIRRAYFDLIGLPPSPAEVDAFVNEPAADAYEKLLDRLLANPHHGERWARHWLDLARFAESHGFEHDYDRPNAYPYRDFVIKAFNQDLPYNTFVKWQIAGDEYEPDNPLALMATGFLAAGTHSTQITKNLVEKERYEELDDMARTTGTALLGLTIGCARCHDHKYDPIPTRDYYRLIATFTTTVRSDYDVPLDPEGDRKVRARFEAEHRPVAEALRRYEVENQPSRFAQWLKNQPIGPWWLLPDLAKLGRTGDAKLTNSERTRLLAWFRVVDPEWQERKRQVVEHMKTAPRLTTLKVLISSEGVPPLRLHTQGADYLEQTYFLKRGDPDQKDGVAPQGFLQVLTRAADQEKHWQVAPPRGWRTSYRRRAFAEWLTDADQGAGQLLARVIVNRLWQHHLGRGLVATASDFGFQGERPTHPELLDWLASELIRGGWRLRPIHKLILTSAVYRQSAVHDSRRNAADPENRLLWHFPMHRLEAEIVRDAMLAVSGTLDERSFGPGTLDPNHKRRSIYFFVKRSKLVPAMVLFDAPDALQSIDRRPTTTVAPQALLLMNSTAVRDYAENFARRIGGAGSKTLPDVIREGYEIALGRPPSASELTDSVSFLQEQMASYQASHRDNARQVALADFCQVLLGLNEFVYVD